MTTRWLALASAVIVTATMLALVGRDYPLIGHDYRYFVPRLIDTDLHLRINGPTIQWYTPTFGSGLPAFPNPQHLEYSLPQLLTLVVDPWLALLTTTALITVAGHAAFFAFARQLLGLGSAAATLGAIFFVSSGFSIERLIVGHVGFQLYPLAALLLWMLVDRRWSDLTRGAIAGLLIAATIYHGGSLLIIIIGLSMGLCLPLLTLLRPDLLEFTRVTRTAMIALAFSVMISAPKIVSALMLMRQFPRQVADVSTVPVAQGVAGLLSQLAGAETLIPLLAIARIDVARVYGVLVNLTGTDFGMWELDSGLSPVLFACLGIGGWAAFTAWRRGQLPPLNRTQVIAAAALVAAIWIIVESALARGLVYPLVKSLPILQALHVNPRLAGVFVLPLALLSAIAIDPWLTQPRRDRAAVVLIVAAWLAPLSYFVLPAQMHFRNYDVTRSLADYDAVRRGERFAVRRQLVATDAEALSMHGSSLLPYDPLFGYGNQAFTPQTAPGDIWVSRDGYWNMTHPASLVFPELNGVTPFERIREDDRGRLEAFLSRQQPDWAIPGSVRLLNALALMTLTACIVIVALGIRGSARAPR